MGRGRVISVFAVTSFFMWLLPIAVLQAFNKNVVPGFKNLSSQSKTLWSGGLAVLSVNLVIAMYILMALKEPPVASTPHPDPAFSRRAQVTLAQLSGSQQQQQQQQRQQRRSESSGTSTRPDGAGQKSRKSD